MNFFSAGDGKFAFNSKYKVDIGEDEPIEVSKLKLYKFDRGGTKKKKRNVNEEATREVMDVVPYEGPGAGTDSSSENTTSRKSVTLEEAKREVAEALKEIWQLPESERSSAIKRLIRQWHPDKNQDCESLANEVTKFLLNEVERLKKGGKPGYHPEESNTPSKGPSRSHSTWDGPDFSEFFRSYQRRARQ